MQIYYSLSKLHMSLTQ